MVAVFTGNGLGLFDSSLATLGATTGGAASLGQGRDRQYVNVAQGNLVLQAADEHLNFRGLSVGLNRTYNSLGQLSDVGADGWLTGFERKVGLVDTLNAAGSRVRLQQGDGTTTEFQYDTATRRYVSTAGTGAHDTLAWDAGSRTWTLTEGSTRRQELFADHADASLQGRLLRIQSGQSDANGPARFDVLYDAAGRVVEVRAGTGDSVADGLLFAYDSAGRLVGLSTRENGLVLTQVQYAYDARGRLQAVVTDLTPQVASDNTWDASVPGNNDGLRFRTEYAYVGDGLQVASVRQSDGYVASYTYRVDGRLASATYGEGSSAQTTRFSYDVSGRTTDVADASGSTWSYGYDAQGQLIRQLAPAVDGQRDVTEFSYDTAGNLVQSVRSRGAQVLSRSDYRYDQNGNRTWEWDGEGRGTLRTYTATNQLASETTYTDPDVGRTGVETLGDNTVKRYVYDSLDRLRFTVNAYGGVTEFQYGTNGNGIGLQSLRTVYDGGDGYARFTGSMASDTIEADLAQWAQQHQAVANLSTYQYDARGQLVLSVEYSQTNASGVGVLNALARVTRYTYDAQGLLRQQIALHAPPAAAINLAVAASAASEVIDYAYDGMGRLLSTLRRGGGTSAASAQSDPAGFDASTQQTTYTYLDAQRQLRTTYDSGLIRVETHDEQGRTVSVQDTGVVNGGAQVRTSRNVYDALGRLRASQDATGARQYFFYDDKGRLTGTVDATGALIVMVYDGADNRVRATAYANRLDTSGWLSGETVVPTTLADLTVVADAGRDRTTRYGYDAGGLLVSMTDPSGQVERYAYDAKKNLVRVTAGEGEAQRITRHFYNALAQKEATLDAEGYLVRLVYGYSGQLLGEVRYSTQVAQALREKTLWDLVPPATASDQKTTHFYDGLGERIGTLDAEGYLTRIFNRQNQNAKDTNRAKVALSEVYRDAPLDTLWAAIPTSVYGRKDVVLQREVYDAFAQKISDVAYGDYATLADFQSTDYSYDEAGRLVAARAVEPAGTTVVSARRYDVFGNVIGELGGVGAAQLTAGMSQTQIQGIYAAWGTSSRYDAADRLIEQTDAQGAKTWLIRDQAGRVRYTVKGLRDDAGLVNGTGEVVETRYDAFGEVTEQIAYGTRVVLPAAATADQVGQVLGALRYVQSRDARTAMEYDRNGRVLAQTDALGTLTRYRYDAFGQKIATERAAGATLATTTRYSYDRRGLLTSSVADADGFGLTNRLQRDAFGRIATAIDARGNTTTYAYDRLNRQTATTVWVDGIGNTSSIEYDGLSRVTKRIDARGNATTYVYDDVIDSVKVVTAEGRVSESFYDARGRLVRTLDGADTRYGYDADGHRVSVSDQNADHSLDYRYDAAGRLVWDGRKGVAYGYDAVGRLTRKTEGNAAAGETVRVTRYEYDALGRMVKTIEPDGMVTLMRYDVAGNLIETVMDPDHLQLRTTYAWDVLGHQLSVVQAAGTDAATETRYAYDTAGRKISETRSPGGLNLTTRYVYDQNGNVVAQTDASGRTQRFVYDSANRLRFSVDAAGGATAFTYDAAGRLTSERHYAQTLDLAGAGDVLDSGWVQSRLSPQDARDQQQYTVYDRDGLVSASIDGAGGVVAYLRDRFGRVAKETRYAIPLALSASRIVELQQGTVGLSALAPQATPERDRVTWQVYDNSGYLAFTIDGTGAVVQYINDAYESDRLHAKRAYAMWVPLEAQVDVALASGATKTMSVIDLLNGAGGYEILFDNIGRVLDDPSIDWSGTREVAYFYDTAGRVRYEVTRTGASDNATREYVYDASGRLTKQIDYGFTIQQSADSSYTFADETTESVGQKLAAQLEVWNGTQAAPFRTTTFLYDSAGRRVYTIDPSGAVARMFLDSGGRVVAQRTYQARINTLPASAQALDAVLDSTQAGPTSWRQTQSAYDAAGRLVRQTDALGSTETYSYDGAGHLLSRQDRNGAVWTYSYDAAGNKTAQFSPAVTVAAADASGVVTSTQRSIATRYIYDGQGNVTSMIEDADGGRPRITRYEYDSRGHQIRTIFPDAGRLNAAGELVASGQSATVEITYDAFGNAIMQKDVSGKYSYKAYDNQGRLTYEVDAEGYVTSYAYTAFGEQWRLTRHAYMANIPTDRPDTNPESIDRNLQWMNSTGDRTVYTFYDRAGRKSSVGTMPTFGGGAALSRASDEMQITSWHQYPSEQDMEWGATSRTMFYYDAFGNLRKQAVLLNRDQSDENIDLGYGTYAVTYHLYDANGREVRRTDAEGYVTTYEYTATGQLAKQTEYAVPVTGPGPRDLNDVSPSENDRSTTYAYDALGRKISETVTRRAQDRFGTESVGPLVNTYTYDSEGRLTQSRINNQILNMAYDALGRMVLTREAVRDAISAAAPGLLASGEFAGIDDPKLYQDVLPTTTMRYDAFGNLVEQSSGADGANWVTQTFRYDWQGRNVWQRDVLGNELTRTFDAADRVLEERRKIGYATFSQSEGGKFSYTWKAAAELGEWAWFSTRYSYDNIGRQNVKQSFRESFVSNQSLGEVVEASERVQYNAFGEIEAKNTRNASWDMDQTTRYQYDDRGNVEWTNADGVERSFTHDAGNRQISESHLVGSSDGDANAGWLVRSSMDLDRLGRVVKRTRTAHDQNGNATDSVTQHTYDRWGNQIRVRDAKGNETSFAYNDANQLISQTAPEVKVVSASGVTTFERPVMRWFYDAMGQLVGTRDANGNGRRYQYDIRGRMTSEEDATGGIKRYRYDALGRQTLSSDADGTLTLKQVDAAGRVVSVWADNGNKTDGQRSWQEMERYVLDQDGNRLVSIDSTGKVTKASYDSQGRMIRSESATGVVMEYAYDLRGNKIMERNALARSNRENSAEGWNWRFDREGEQVYLDEKTWKYDAFDRVIDHNDLSGLDYDYTYDPQSGQLLSVSISNRPSGFTAFRASSQMEQAPEFPGDPGDPGDPEPPTPPVVESQRNYVYNADGLIARIEEPSASRDPATGAQRINATRYAYDANGNRTLEETTSYDANNQLLQIATRTSYDAHNRIERVIQDDLVAQRRLLDVRYSYDAVGNRRLVEMGSAFNPAGEQPSNASFEDGNRGWTSGEGWVISQRGAGGAATTGTWGAEFKGSNNGPQSITNNKRVAVSAGQTITASAMIQQGASDAGAANARVLVIWYDAAGTMLPGGDGKSWSSGNLVTSGSDGNWGKSELTTTVPPGAAFMAIGGSASKGINANSLWMDDFQWTIGPIPNPAPINAGMEQGSSNWDLGEGWTIGQEGANGDAFTGTFSAQFNGSNSGPKTITNQERVPVVPGKRVTASVMVQQGASSAGDASAQVLIVWYDADGNMLPGGLGSSWSSGNVVDSGSDGRWHQSSVTATVPPGAAFMTIGASALKGAGGDPLWVDDFQWTYTPVEPGIKELPVDKAYWFEYDKENRVTVSNGVLQDGQIVVANDDTSSLQSYDADGKVALRQSYDNGVLKRQQLFYDDQGRVVRIVQTLPDGVTRLLETSRYDSSGRLLERRQYADDGSAKRIDASSYDADGRLISQSAYGIPMGGVYQPVDEDGNPLPLPDDGLEGLQLLSVVNYQDGTLATGYDAAGRLRGYRYSLVRNEQGSGMTTPEGYTHTYRYTYQGAETYLTQQVTGTSTHRDFKTSNSTSTFDAWGKLLSVRENTPGGKVDDRLRYFTMDAEGNILRRTEGTFEGGRFTQDDAERLRTEQYAFANGQYVAAGRFDGKTDVLGQMNAYASTDVGTYKVTVQAGDTLRGLAQRLYGNSNLWYVLAEANAIDDDSGLVAGATLNVPDVKANTNDATTFKPFNASEAVGSTTPSLPFIPKPPEAGCGTLGMIIMVVVAVVVTYFTAGATSGYFAAAFGAASSTAGAVAASAATYAVAGAAGSIASQGVGSAMGQTSFSWRNVAASALASGATAGVSTAVSASVGPVVGAVSTAAVGNVSNYLANRLVGNEASFSWRSVAASAVTAGITQKLAPTIAQSIGVDTMKYGQSTVAGITGGVVSAAVRRGSIDYTDLAVDAFSNVLVNSLTQTSSSSLFDPDTAVASENGGGAPGRYVRDRNGDLTLDTVEVRATRSNISSIQVRGSDQELRDQALMRAVGAQTVENIRADRRRSNAIDVGAFQRSNALDIGGINAARMAPSTVRPLAPMPINPEAITIEPNSISGWEVSGSFVEGVGNAFIGIGREVVDTPLRVGDMALAAAAVTTNLFRDEGDYWLPEMSSGMARDYERSGQTWDQFSLDHNPLYAATVGLGTAIGNGAGAAIVDNDYRPLANLGGEFAGGLLVGKGMSRYGSYGVMFDDIGASGLGRSQAGSVGVQFGSLTDRVERVSSRPQWLQRLDAGNAFNSERASAYSYNEIYINRPGGSGYYRLDSYSPATGEIVSRKFTQFADIKPQTALGYVNEIPAKYPVGGVIADVPSSGLLSGQILRGQYILEVPVQVRPIPPFVLDGANRAGVLIRDVNGRIY
ncbi:LysM peptidoglycan-binding domain-containing protein [Xanthomonas cucurbitae]|uniref:LysM domain protein n=1 Tax=Xanthomonas cucurbitae TaxID=56453 RepID=A0ABY7YC94_9XANT|nr:LysM peptidoglycan-binding domain-containing protein [Xanthomonas cucurbitae]WDM67618.1 LysM domain protein [Xanthomonas cucurbitae]WDM71494.1 LysM domain protein [Xanthomonas cucurbitae]